MPIKKQLANTVSDDDEAGENEYFRCNVVYEVDKHVALAELPPHRLSIIKFSWIQLRMWIIPIAYMLYVN